MLSSHPNIEHKIIKMEIKIHKKDLKKSFSFENLYFFRVLYFYFDILIKIKF